MIEKHFGPGVPSYKELDRKAAIAFVSTNPVMDYRVPIPENIIPVAGLHIKDPKPLPEVLTNHCISFHSPKEY